MFENLRRGRQARNFTTNVPKILDLKSSSEQIFSRKLPLGAPETVKRLTEERVNHLEKMLKIGGKAYQSYRFLLLNPKELKPRTTLLRVLKRHPLYLFKLYCVQFPSVGVRRNSEMKKKGIAGSLPRKQSPWIFLHKSTFQIPNKLS